MKVPVLLEAVSEDGPYIVTMGELLLSVNADNKLESTGFRSQKPLNQSQAIDKILLLNLIHLGDG